MNAKPTGLVQRNCQQPSEAPKITPGFSAVCVGVFSVSCSPSYTVFMSFSVLPLLSVCHRLRVLISLWYHQPIFKNQIIF